MKKRIRAIIFDGNNIILIKRVKMDDEYWVFPGGLVEEGETIKGALKRECKEELGIEIKVGKLLIKRDLLLYEDKQVEYFYFCEKVSGVLGTGEGPEFSEYKDKGWGTHEPIALPKNKISDLDLLPDEVKQMVLKNL
jgi:mutator protein MutT